MCCRQTVAKMDSERRSRSTCLSKMSTVSLDSGHVVVEVGDSLGYEARLVKAITTGCPQKNDLLLWRAVAPINFDLGIKVGGVLESSGSQL